MSIPPTLLIVLDGADRLEDDAVGDAALRHFGITPEVQNGQIILQTQVARAAALSLGVDEPDQVETITIVIK